MQVSPAKLIELPPCPLHGDPEVDALYVNPDHVVGAIQRGSSTDVLCLGNTVLVTSLSAQELVRALSSPPLVEV